MQDFDEKSTNMHMGRLIQMLSHQMKRKNCIVAMIDGDSLTVMQKHILKFILLETLHREIYQKDIEKFFGLKKSTITSILNSLEDAGYIERKVGKDDGRLRRIVLTEKGFAMNEKVHNEFETLEENMSNLFSEDEYNNLIASLEKIRNYLEGKDD